MHKVIQYYTLVITLVVCSAVPSYTEKRSHSSERATQSMTQRKRKRNSQNKEPIFLKVVLTACIVVVLFFLANPVIKEYQYRKEVSNLNDKEKKQLEELKRREKEKSGSGLVYAIDVGAVKVAKLYLKYKNPDVNGEDEDGNSSLHCAIEKGDEKIVQDLIAKGVDPNKYNKSHDGQENHYTPLHTAVDEGKMEMVKLLISGGADVNLIDENGYSPVHLAIEKDYMEIAKLLLEQENINIDLENEKDCSSLHLALYKNETGIAKLLLKQENINVNLIDDRGKSPLHIAIERKQKDIINDLIEAGADVNLYSKYVEYDGRLSENEETPLHTALSRGKIEIAKKLLGQEKINVNLEDKDGNSPLHIAIEGGYGKIVDLLIEAGADVNALNGDGNSPLCLALHKNQIEIAKKLLGQENINVNLKDKDGKSPLRIAIEKGYEKIAETLLLKDEGTDVNTLDKDGDSLLHTAIQKGYKEIVNGFLSKKRANPNLFSKYKDYSQNTSGYLGRFVWKNEYTPLYLALLCGEEEIAKLLLNQDNIDVSLTNRSDRSQGKRKTALDLAQERDYAEIVTILQEKANNSS